IPVHPSSFGSLHDRACEIFYELKGGKIDYGKEHSRKYCHSQFGLYYEGVLKEWNEEKPIVLIGKGYGAQTILYLQYLLAIDFFKCQSNDKWIKAVITIEGSLRGSTLPYVLGLKPFTKSVIHPISILQLILSLIHLLLYFNLPVIYLFGLQLMNYYWNLSKKQQSSFWCALIGRSSYSNLEDNFIYDYSLEGAAWHSKLYPISSNCIYLNYVISNSMKSKITGYHLPRPSQFKRFLLSWFLGRFQFIHNDLNEYEELTKYWPNNGLVPTICQLPPKHHPNQFKLELHNKILDPILYSMELGKWHTIFTCQQNMRLFQSQQQFYESNIKNTYQFYLQYHLDPFYLLIMETIEQCL
ncbi:alpha/beta-hydrolase, partial [Neoconidiobolus thromboides FSU 785]